MIGYGKFMESEIKIEHFRSKYGSRLMAIPGVTGVGLGISSHGRPCLKIYTSVNTEEISPNLPEEIEEIEFELEYVGEIKAQ